MTAELQTNQSSTLATHFAKSNRFSKLTILMIKIFNT